MENKIINRLKDLYKHRTEIEKKLVISLRYITKDEQIQENINNLSEMRGRIQELEDILTQEQVNNIKSELGVDFC